MQFVSLDVRTQLVKDRGANLGISVVPVLIQFEWHQHANAISRGVVERDAVELSFEPAFDGVDAEPPHVAEVALVERRPLGWTEARVLRVITHTPNRVWGAVDEIVPTAG